MVGIGVQFNETPVVVGLVILFVAATGVFLLHKMEKQLHGKEWSVEEDALAFLTDAGLAV